MWNLILRLLRLRTFIRVLRSPFSWSSLLFMIITWLLGRKR